MSSPSLEAIEVMAIVRTCPRNSNRVGHGLATARHAAPALLRRSGRHLEGATPWLARCEIRGESSPVMSVTSNDQGSPEDPRACHETVRNSTQIPKGERPHSPRGRQEINMKREPGWRWILEFVRVTLGDRISGVVAIGLLVWMLTLLTFVVATKDVPLLARLLAS